MDSLVLFSHGSLLCGSGDALNRHAESLRKSGSWFAVEVGYLNYSEPTFADSVCKLVLEGASRIVVVPYFLVPGYFVGKALPRELEPLKAQFPNVEFVVADAIGFDEMVADAVELSAESPLEHGEWRECIGIAARNCRPSPTCPLYGTHQCPKVPTSPET